MKLVRRLVISALNYNILFKAKHIPGKLNVISDKLSRLLIHDARTVAPWLDKNMAQILKERIYI